MGINGLFPRLAPACHPTDLIALLRPGLPIDAHVQDTVATTDTNDATNDRPSKRRRATAKQSPHRHSGQRRRVRVAVDASGWIARAAHGQGGHLLDDRHLSNYGRAELAGRVTIAAGGGEGRLQPDGSGGGSGDCRGGGGGGGENNSAAEGGGGGGDQPQQPQQPPQPAPSYQEGLRQEFISRCVTTVLNRILTLRDECRADVLVVLDGASPPVKYGTVGERRGRRDKAVEVRDASVAMGQAGEVDELVMAARSTSTGAAGAAGAAAAETAGAAAAAETAGPSESDRISAAKRAGASTSKIQYAVVRAVLTALQSEYIPYLVAPYEADGQLAYLGKTGMVDMVLTDDTDLVGCGTPAILYKFSDWGLANGNGGGNASGGGVTGQLLLRSRLSCTPSPLNLMDFTDVMLAVLFVAAGCDYCASLKGIGVVTARKCVKEAFHGYGPGMLSCEADGENPLSKRRARAVVGDDEEESVLGKLFRLLYNSGYGGRKMTQEERTEYEANFCKALVMYRHPVVFDPVGGKCIVVNDPADGGADPELLTFEPYADLVNDPTKLQGVVGKILDPARAALIAEGQFNARTGKRFDEEEEEEEIAAAEEENQEQDTASAAANVETAAGPNDSNAAMLIDTGEEKDNGGEKREEGKRQVQPMEEEKEDGDGDKKPRVRGRKHCRIDGCKKYRQSGCDDMCQAHFREAQKEAAANDSSTTDAGGNEEPIPETQQAQPEPKPQTQEAREEAAADDSSTNDADGTEEQVLPETQQAQLEPESQTEDMESPPLQGPTQALADAGEKALQDVHQLAAAEESPSATEDEGTEEQFRLETQGRLPETQAPFPETQTQEQWALEELTPAAAAAAEAQQPAIGTQDSKALQATTPTTNRTGQTLSSSSSKPLTQASSSHIPSSLSADALSPALLERSPEAGKKAASPEKTEDAKATPGRQPAPTQHKSGIQGVLARLMGRK